MSVKGDLIYETLQMRTGDVDRLSNALQLSRTRAYKEGWNYLAKQTGVRGQLLLDDTTVRNLRQKSTQEASQIVDTYNKDLRRAIETAESTYPTATVQQLALEVSEWNARREEFKSPQVSLWVNGDARQDAETEFFRANPSISGKGRVVPTYAAEPGCQAMVDAGWQPLAIALGWRVPLHPNCIHQKEFDFDKSTTPSTGNILGNIWSAILQRIGIR